MTTVETVKGPVPLSDMGVTLTHEHLFTKNREIEDNWPDPEWLGEDAMVDKAVAMLADLKAKGIDTIIDLTVPGLGRYIPRIQRVAERSDVHIVVATGFYTFDALPTYFTTHRPGGAVDGPDPLPAFFVRDIQDGIADTGVKAAVIKVAVDSAGITPDLERVLEAAATAHLETGATITTHTHAAEFRGRDQQEFLGKLGVPLEHVVIGHSGDSEDIDYLLELIDNGSLLGMDRFGMTQVLADDKRIDMVVALCERGYADRLTLSHDAGVFSINTPPSNRSSVSPDWRHDHLSVDVLPVLRERGVTDAQIRQMMVDNAAKVLVGARS
jgi:phosphotriesterase-related protein